MKWIKFALPVLVILILGGVWQLAGSFHLVSAYLLPSPLQVLGALVEFRNELFAAFSDTCSLALQGLCLSFIIGNTLALFFSAIPLLQAAFLPIAVFFQTVPIIAIAPLLVVWFGFGEPTVRASATIVSFFPILASTLKGLSLKDPQMQELFQLYNASKFQKLLKLGIPSSLPFVLSGLEVGGGLAIIGAIVGEFIAGGGLGAIVDSARTQQRTDLVFAAVLLSSLLGLSLILLIQLISYVLTKRRPYFHL